MDRQDEIRMERMERVIEKCKQQDNVSPSDLMEVQRSMLEHVNIGIKQNPLDFMLILQSPKGPNGDDGILSSVLQGSTCPLGVVFRLMTLENAIEVSRMKLMAMLVKNGAEEEDLPLLMKALKEFIKVQSHSDTGVHCVDVEDYTEHMEKLNGKKMENN